MTCGPAICTFDMVCFLELRDIIQKVLLILPISLTDRSTASLIKEILEGESAVGSINAKIINQFCAQEIIMLHEGALYKPRII